MHITARGNITVGIINVAAGSIAIAHGSATTSIGSTTLNVAGFFGCLLVGIGFIRFVRGINQWLVRRRTDMCDCGHPRAKHFIWCTGLLWDDSPVECDCTVFNPRKD